MFTSTPFEQSTISLKTNAVKNILFRLSTITLQFAIFRLCAYIAYLKNDYTSFLMFAEDIIQRLLFIISRGMRRRCNVIIVLIFTIAFASASIYDTLLWVLDSPGYVVRSKVVDGSALTSNLLPNPSYVSTISDPDHNLEQINIEETLASNLFIPDFNFSITRNDYTPTPEAIIPAPQNMTSHWPPRIYLDESGFGLGFNVRYTTVETPCSANVSKDDSQYAFWACNLSGQEATAFMIEPVEQPVVWWANNWPMNLSPTPNNPWTSLRVEPDATTAMKQVVTLTKGNKRHTFFQTTLVFSMYSFGMIAEDEIRTLIQRSFTLFSGNSILTSAFAKACIDAQINGTNIITRGFMFQNATYPAIALTSVDFINDMKGETRNGGFLHITYTSIELFRSEELPEPVQPAAPCDGTVCNIAAGGRIQSHPCFPTSTESPSNEFVGQVDTSAVAIITDVLGDGSNDTSAVAFNHTGEQWYMANRDRIDQSLLSRAFLIGGNAGSVRIAVHHNEPAISYLQLLLIILPFIMALSTSALMFRDKYGYYKKSLFASLSTTCFTKTETRVFVGYIINPPTFVVLKSGIGTQDGPISIDREEQLEDMKPHTKDVEGGEEIAKLLPEMTSRPMSSYSRNLS